MRHATVEKQVPDSRDLGQIWAAALPTAVAQLFRPVLVGRVQYLAPWVHTRGLSSMVAATYDVLHRI